MADAAIADVLARGVRGSSHATHRRQEGQDQGWDRSQYSYRGARRQAAARCDRHRDEQGRQEQAEEAAGLIPAAFKSEGR